MILNSLAISETASDQALSFDMAGGLDDGLRHFRLHYLAPCDCRRVPLPDASIDIVTSRAVLEHIPPSVIDEIFLDSFRVLVPDGLACHVVDNSDHWEHRDKSISTVNFLKFSDFVFRLTCINSLNYQNRLRHSEYLDLLLRSGFEILRQHGHVDARAVSALQSLPVAERFRRFAPEELATISSYLLGAKAASSRANGAELPS